MFLKHCVQCRRGTDIDLDLFAVGVFDGGVIGFYPYVLDELSCGCASQCMSRACKSGRNCTCQLDNSCPLRLKGLLVRFVDDAAMLSMLWLPDPKTTMFNSLKGFVSH